MKFRVAQPDQGLSIDTNSVIGFALESEPLFSDTILVLFVTMTKIHNRNCQSQERSILFYGFRMFQTILVGIHGGAS